MIWRYPWNGIERRGDLRIFGYGSLISESSIANTIRAFKDYQPALTSNLIRIFNYLTWTRTVLNVKRDSKIINGVVFTIPPNEIWKFRNREVWYDLMEVPCYDWETGEDIGKAYTCICTHRYRLAQYTPPDEWYYRKIKTACRKISEDFLDHFMKTTITANGIPIQSWEDKTY